MDKNSIMELLKQSDIISNVEEIEYKPDFLIVRFFYGYSEDELEAAKDYANTEASNEDDEDKWYDEYYIPYLIDIAVDEISDTIEDMIEKSSLNAEYVSYEPGREDKTSEFIAVFTDASKEFDIDEILDSIGI